MGREIDLLARYPRTKRDPAARAAARADEDRRIARAFGREFFDGERRHGYGGYSYSPRYWEPVVPDLRDALGLGPGRRVLDVGCAKGFLLHDLRRLIPGLRVAGIDVSRYAVAHARPEVRRFLQVADARALPFPDHAFDAVLSITTLHNLDRAGCAQALREIERVSRGRKFITVDAYRDEEERRRMEDWNLTALTCMHVDEWRRFFREAGYTGDYFWFVP